MVATMMLSQSSLSDKWRFTGTRSNLAFSESVADSSRLRLLRLTQRRFDDQNGDTSKQLSMQTRHVPSRHQIMSWNMAQKSIMHRALARPKTVEDWGEWCIYGKP